MTRDPPRHFTDEEVRDMRVRYHEGRVTQADLADEFEVSQGWISKVVRGLRRPEAGGPIKDEDQRTLEGRRG